MFANARLLFISVDGFHYSSGGQVILTVNSFSIASPFDRPRDTISNRDSTRPNETSIITMIGGRGCQGFCDDSFWSLQECYNADKYPAFECGCQTINLTSVEGGRIAHYHPQKIGPYSTHFFHISIIISNA
jgi:hypothetical protein